MNAPDSLPDDETLEAAAYAALTDALRPVPLADSRRAAMRARILAQAAPPPAGTETFRVQDGGWFSPAPRIEMKLLRCDEAAGTQELLIRLGAGVRIPEHSHAKEEQMVILSGECHLGEHLLRAGDTHVAPPGSWHPAITVEQEVLMLLRAEYPLPAG